MGISLKDVARQAGVSVKTVSNVVNGYRNVTPETRFKVQRVIDELGYCPNPTARHLRKGRTGMIALAVPEPHNPYFAELADAVVEHAAGLDCIVLLDHTGGDATRRSSSPRGSARVSSMGSSSAPSNSRTRIRSHAAATHPWSCSANASTTPPTTTSPSTTSPPPAPPRPTSSTSDAAASLSSEHATAAYAPAPTCACAVCARS